MEEPKKPFELSPDQPEQSSVPPTFKPTVVNQTQTGFNLSNVQTETTKPSETGRKGLSVGAVVAIFSAVFLIELLISIGIISFLATLPIKFDDDSTSTNKEIVGIQTSTCQFAEFDPKAKDPHESFWGSLGSCDDKYAQALNNASLSFSKAKFDEEKAYADEALKLAKTSYQKGVAYYWRGHYFNDIRNFKAAEFELSASLQTAPQFAPTLSLLNAVFNNQRNYQEGLNYGRNCLAFNTEYPYCHLNYGVSLLQTGGKTEGLAEIDRAHELAPNDSDVMVFYNWAHQNFK